MPPREAAAATRGGASHFKAVSSKLWERQGKNRGTTRFQAKCYGHIASGEFPEGHQRLTPAAPCSGAPAPPRCGGPQKWPMKSPDGARVLLRSPHMTRTWEAWTNPAMKRRGSERWVATKEGRKCRVGWGLRALRVSCPSADLIKRWLGLWNGGDAKSLGVWNGGDAKSLGLWNGGDAKSLGLWNISGVCQEGLKAPIIAGVWYMVLPQNTRSSSIAPRVNAGARFAAKKKNQKTQKVLVFDSGRTVVKLSTGLVAKRSLPK